MKNVHFLVVAAIVLTGCGTAPTLPNGGRTANTMAAEATKQASKSDPFAGMHVTKAYYMDEIYQVLTAKLPGGRDLKINLVDGICITVTKTDLDVMADPKLTRQLIAALEAAAKAEPKGVRKSVIQEIVDAVRGGI